MTKPMTSYRRVSGDIDEAIAIHALLQQDFETRLPELRNDTKAIAKAAARVEKWAEIVADLSTPAPKASTAVPAGEAAATTAIAPVDPAAPSRSKPRPNTGTNPTA